MTTTKRPSKEMIGRLAELNPGLLNPLVAFFVMGWDRVFVNARPMHGLNQRKEPRKLPDYVRSWGVDRCVHYLLESPPERSGANDYLSLWLEKVSAG
jgi:hypothetical protein